MAREEGREGGRGERESEREVAGRRGGFREKEERLTCFVHVSERHTVADSAGF